MEARRLIHPKANLTYIIRLSNKKLGDGSRHVFKRGGIISGEDLTEHITTPLPTNYLEPHIKVELDRFGANAFSVEPYKGELPRTVNVTIYTANI